ncbi:MAG TPA: type II toxin-antitoxin system PemK/MazF family toxin [Gemmatimonadales bacterium]|nr:type II toxin-antitoxin system PemK/MazF family toxin [Gemmatimonadales bacterium]
MRRGKVWTVNPLTHPTPRPAVVLSADAWNEHAPDVVLIPLTTRPGPSRPPVTHPRLEHPSYAKCGAIAALPKTRLKERLGKLHERSMTAIALEVKRLLAP